MSLIRAKIVQDKPICEQLETEQIALKNTMLLTKDAQIKVVQDVEQYKTERNSLTKRKVWLYLASRFVNRTFIPSDRKLSMGSSKLLMRPSQELVRGLFNLQNGSKGRFLVCLPAPLKRRKRLQCMRRRRETCKQRLMHCTISKRPVTQIVPVLPAEIVQDVRGCIEQLQMIDAEVQKLQRSQKDFAKQQNDLEGKVIEKNELLLRQQVSYSIRTFLSLEIQLSMAV